MEVHLSRDLEDKLVHSAAKQGRAADELVQEVLTRYLADEARFFEVVERWTAEERHAAISHIEEGFLQAERGQLVEGDQARRDIRGMKDDWRRERSRKR